MSYTVKLMKMITPIALAISLAACGGDSSFGNKSANNPTSNTDVSSILLSSSGDLNSDGLSPLILSATARNGSQALSGVNLNFNVYSDSSATTIDSFATISNKSTSGSNVTAELIPGSPANRRLYIRASSDDNVQSNIRGIYVTGTTVAIDGADAIASGTSADYILKIRDSGNKAITSGETVEITSANGNSINAGNFITDNKGEILFTLSGDQLGQDTVTAKALGAIIHKVVNVSGDEFSINSNNNEVNINTNETINFIWKKDNIVQSGKQITVSTTRGTILPNTTLVTDSNGQATFTISSPTAGNSTITVTSNADGLSTTLDLEFVATTPAYLNTQASPTTVVPNGSSTITATITDAQNNPVKNKTIDFNLNDTVNGSLSASTAVTDSAGRASVSYTAGNSTSAKDGVVITTYIQGYPSVASDIVNLTVGGDALRISLGKDHLISATDVFYTKQIGVLVSDSAGNPVKNTQVDFTIKPTDYFKGQMYAVADEWQEGSELVDTNSDGILDSLNPPIKCATEDSNDNGIIEAGEDFNSNGTLEPTKDATISISNGGKTDDSGAIVVELKYLKSRARWSKQTITATISGVGTEYKEELSFILPILAADASSIDIEVPNRYSPYGQALICSDSN